MQDEFTDLGGVLDNFDFGGQWLSGHSELLSLEFDADQEEQKPRVVGGGKGVQSGVVPTENRD